MSLQLGLGLGIYTPKYINGSGPGLSFSMDFSSAENSSYVAIISSFVG